MKTETFKIWYQQIDGEGKVIGTGVYHKEYVRWGTALNVARKLYDGNPNIRYDISRLNPFIEHSIEVSCELCGRPYTVKIDSFSCHPRHNDHYYIRTSSNPRYQHGDVCKDCGEKITNFIESLKVDKEATDE